MPLSGNYSDAMVDKFRDSFIHQSQQTGSRLEQAISVENIDGNRTYFTKMGSVSARTKTARLEDSFLEEPSYERRQLIFKTNSFSHAMDIDDLIRYVNNPQSDLVTAAVNAMGRRKDEIIMEAISGNATKIVDGSTSSQGLTLSVAKASTAFGGSSSALSVAKLREAIAKIEANYGNEGGEELTLVAPIGQLLELSRSAEVSSGDYRSGRVLEGPGVQKGKLGGFLGVNFIAYENTGLDGSDQLAFLFKKSAIKLGIAKPLTVSMRELTSKIGNPTKIEAIESIGATRIHEEQVVKLILAAV